ncbi:MAG: ABC transporter ATP-binding protein [Pseudonocardiaceae bacterium]
MRLVVAGVAVALEGCPIVTDAELVVEPDEFVGLVGPNGCGKSTLLRSIYRALRPAAGLISLDGEDLWRLPAREAARRVAVVAQEGPSDLDFTVEEVVALGRTPHKRPLDRDTDADRKICTDALDRVNMAAARQRSYATLSGGEKQRVQVARALAQRSYLHLLDEPTNHLDIRYQLEILRLVRGLGHATLAAIHDLNLASQYCDRIYIMATGRIVASGPPEEVLSTERIAECFGVRAHRWTHPGTGRPILAFDELDPASVVGRARSTAAAVTQGGGS